MSRRRRGWVARVNWLLIAWLAILIAAGYFSRWVPISPLWIGVALAVIVAGFIAAAFLLGHAQVRAEKRGAAEPDHRPGAVRHDCRTHPPACEQTIREYLRELPDWMVEECLQWTRERERRGWQFTGGTAAADNWLAETQRPAVSTPPPGAPQPRLRRPR